MAHVIGDIMLARAICESDNEIAINTMHYRVDSKTGEGATNREIANLLHTLWSPLYVLGMTTLARFVRVEVSKVFPKPPDPKQDSTLGPTNGLVVLSNALPRFTCPILTKQTVFGGVKYRGRVYLPFRCETENDDAGQPTIAGVADWQLIADELSLGHTVVGNDGSTGINPVIFHRADGTYNYVTSIQARTYWGVQRRRNNNRK